MKLLLCTTVAVWLVGCSQAAEESPTATPAGSTPLTTITTTTTALQAATEAAKPTNVAIPTVTPTTPPATVTPTPAANAAAPALTLYINYTFDDETSDATLLPAGYRWLVVVATLENNGVAPVTLSASELTLLLAAGDDVEPAGVSDAFQPALIDTPVDAGQSLLGLVHFAVPNDAEINLLRWCPKTDCSNAVELTIP